jgi:SpoVK/Ycf46/Vps4 family AAA+-type ATPase
MAEIPLPCRNQEGAPLGLLPLGARALIATAEQVARDHNLSKRTALARVLRESLAEAGYAMTDDDLASAIALLERIRYGEDLSAVPLLVRQVEPTSYPTASGGNTLGMPTPHPSSNALTFFEAERVYPNDDAQHWYEQLQGLDEQKERLLIELELLLFPKRLEAWSRTHHHGQILRLCADYQHRVPLILFSGDVGTGKTALAETVGDALARRTNQTVHLLKINTQVRGTGQVGEMSTLIVQAFTQAQERATALKGKPILLLIDEADALTASREMQQMHHEDKAGLNTLLQRLDNLRLTKLPIAALFITNRPEALDPAIRRRAALDLHFARPADEVRAQIIQNAVPEVPMNTSERKALIRLTGESDPRNQGVPFTASDLTDRLLPGALRHAYSAQRALTCDDILSEAAVIVATPAWKREQC